MLQRLVLLTHHIDNVGMTMPNAHGHDSAERIEISAAVLVPEVLHFPFHEHDRLFVVEKNSRIQELLAQTQDFIGQRPVVFLRLVIKRRKLWKFHVDLLFNPKLAPEVGFEPTTNRLTADRSTTELLWIVHARRARPVNFAQAPACSKKIGCGGWI